MAAYRRRWRSGGRGGRAGSRTCIFNRVGSEKKEKNKKERNLHGIVCGQAPYALVLTGTQTERNQQGECRSVTAVNTFTDAP